MWAIIAGSGLEEFPALQLTSELNRETPFGLASSGARYGKLAGEDIIFIPRHGVHHEISPSEINSCANIFLLKKQGVTKLLSISSVGSFHEALKPGDLVVPSQFIDHTKGLRRHTFGGNGLVSHVSLAEPVTIGLVEVLKKHQAAFGFSLHFDKTYLTIEGPAYSTRAESHCYRMMGADIIGMTAFPEYALAREAGICYLACCFVTDYDNWRSEQPFVTTSTVTHMKEVINVSACQLVERFFPLTQDLYLQGCKELNIASGVVSRLEQLNDKQQATLNVLCDLSITKTQSN